MQVCHILLSLFNVQSDLRDQQLIVRCSLSNRGTSQRSIYNPLGDCSLPHVRLGNLLANRSILLLILASAFGVRWLLEQPSSSMWPELPRWQLFRMLLQVLMCVYKVINVYLDIYIFVCSEARTCSISMWLSRSAGVEGPLLDGQIRWLLLEEDLCVVEWPCSLAANLCHS